MTRLAALSGVLSGARPVRAAIERWQVFSQSPLGTRLVPIYAALAGAAVGVLVADRLVRSMWRHAIFTGPDQWRTVALLLTAFWIAIGAVAALAMLGPPAEADGSTGAAGDGRGPDPAAPLEQS